MTLFLKAIRIILENNPPTFEYKQDKAQAARELQHTIEMYHMVAGNKNGGTSHHALGTHQ